MACAWPILYQLSVALISSLVAYSLADPPVLALSSEGCSRARGCGHAGAADAHRQATCFTVLGLRLQVNVPKRDLILSESATMVEQLADRLQAGDVVEGVVTKLADFGAFVSIRSPDDGQMHGAVVGLLDLQSTPLDAQHRLHDCVQSTFSPHQRDIPT